MKPPPSHIAVLYSRGPHLARLAYYLRETYPSAKVTVLLPFGYPQDGIADSISEIIQVPPADAQQLSGRFRVLRIVRALRADMLVIMFPSVKLRLFSRLSGCPEQYCFSINGRFTEIQTHLAAELLQAMTARLFGLITWLKIRFYLNCHKIGK